MDEKNILQPVFQEMQQGFLVTVCKTTQKTTQKANTRDQLIELVRSNPYMTRMELAEALGKSPNTVKEHLAKLKAEGRLKRVGGDRGGVWEVVDD